MRPAPLLVCLLALWAALGVATSMDWLDGRVWWAFGCAVSVLSLIDAISLQRLASPQVRRVLPAVLPVGVPREIVLELCGGSRLTQTVDVHDHVPTHWPVQGLPQTVKLRSGMVIRASRKRCERR